MLGYEPDFVILQELHSTDGNVLTWNPPADYMFFYLNGFALNDGNLKTVPGSHLFRENTGGGATDADIEAWAEGKVHPATGEPLAIRRLECPPCSVVVMWTHATHGVGRKYTRHLHSLGIDGYFPVFEACICHL